MVFTFEVVGIIFLLVMIYLTYYERKRKRISHRSFLFWLVVWCGGIILVILNSYANILLTPLSIMRVLDLYMILAFMFFFAIIFYLFKTVKNSERRVEELVRHIALNENKGSH